MDHFNEALNHNKGSIIGTILAFAFGFIGTVALSDAVLIVGILSGVTTFLYTIWKWRQEYLKTKKKKIKYEKDVN